jgi:hypothetical protein
MEKIKQYGKKLTDKVKDVKIEWDTPKNQGYDLLKDEASSSQGNSAPKKTKDTKKEGDTSKKEA